MGGLARRIGLAVATGYIFIYYSEYAFWARLTGALWSLLVYGVLTFGIHTDLRGRE